MLSCPRREQLWADRLIQVADTHSGKIKAVELGHPPGSKSLCGSFNIRTSGLLPAVSGPRLPHFTAKDQADPGGRPLSPTPPRNC